MNDAVVVSPLIGQTDRLRADGRHVLHRFGKREVRVSFQVARLEDDVHDRTPVGAGEPTPVIVERQSVLTLAAGQFEREREGIEA